MTARLAVLCGHGIGSQADGWDERWRRGVLGGLERKGWSRAEIVWRPVTWSRVLTGQQLAYSSWAATQDASRLGGWLGELGDALLGDALAWGGAARWAIRDEWLDALEAEEVLEADTLAVIGHSLGGVLAWGALVHAQRRARRDARDGLPRQSAADRLGALVLAGSPVAWALTGGGEPVAPSFPRARSTRPILELRATADPLARPIAYPAWERVAPLVESHTLSLGLTPDVHTEYDESDEALGHIVERLAELR